MIELYYWPTPNGWKAAIMLEEIGAEYEVVPVDIGAGEQFTAEFLAISPNNRMPAIVDRQPSGGGNPISVFESGAILEYLADKSGQFLAAAGPERYTALQWVHWQTANLGPMMGNGAHFKFYAPAITGEGVDHAYAVSRFLGEVDRLAGVIDARLLASEFLGGKSYGIADMMSWPWISIAPKIVDDTFWERFPNVKRWHDEIASRPAVLAGKAHLTEMIGRELPAEEQERRRKLLYNQTNETVRDARVKAAQLNPR